GRKVECQRPRRGPLADDDVEPEVLERRVEDLLDRAVQAVDLVHEQDVALLAHDERKARLAEPRRADEQHVVECLAARLRRVERDRELLLDPRLADEIVELARPKRPVELVLLRAHRRCQELGRAHAARLSAARTCSSIGSSWSTSASARSASTTLYPSS